MEKNSFRIPGWRIIRVIGKGSFGTVYEIEKDDVYGSGIRSALKVISIPSSSSEIVDLQNDGYSGQSITEIFQSRRRIGRRALSSGLGGLSGLYPEANPVSGNAPLFLSGFCAECEIPAFRIGFPVLQYE